MNKENLSSVFEQYINRFDELNALDANDEGYKWRVESHFVKYWDIDADDFASMFKTAMEEISKTNLIDNKSVHPIGGIRMLLKQDSEVEFVRQCFRELFSDDGGDLVARQGRILSFMDKINERIEKYESGSWKYPQKINDVIYYLNLWRPWENYIFKSTEATNWANCIEFGDDIGSGADFSLEKYYRMCDELLEAVQGNDTIMKLHAERVAREAHGYDDKLHMLVYDIIYCADTYDFYLQAKASTTSTKERIKKARLRSELEKAQERLESLQRDLEARQREVICVDLTGARVVHKKFGIGTVTSYQDDKLHISFASGDKLFQYPAGIEKGFLTVPDESLMEKVALEIKTKAALDVAEKKAADAKKEYERLKSEMELI